VVAVTGSTSLIWMTVVNFWIASNFRWALLSLAFPWLVALALYWRERQPGRATG
jgi:hypothetical protein